MSRIQKTRPVPRTVYSVDSRNRSYLLNSNTRSQKNGSDVCRTDLFRPAGFTKGTTDMLKQILEEFLQIEGVSTAALIGSDGFLIDYVGKEPEDRDALAALGSCAMTFFSRAGFALDMGPVRQSVLEHEDGTIILTRINENEMLAVLTEAQSPSGRLSYIIPKITTRVAAVI